MESDHKNHNFLVHCSRKKIIVKLAPKCEQQAILRGDFPVDTPFYL